MSAIRTSCTSTSCCLHEVEQQVQGSAEHRQVRPCTTCAAQCSLDSARGPQARGGLDANRLPPQRFDPQPFRATLPPGSQMAFQDRTSPVDHRLRGRSGAPSRPSTHRRERSTRVVEQHPRARGPRRDGRDGQGRHHRAKDLGDVRVDRNPVDLPPPGRGHPRRPRPRDATATCSSRCRSRARPKRCSALLAFGQVAVDVPVVAMTQSKRRPSLAPPRGRGPGRSATCPKRPAASRSRRPASTTAMIATRRRPGARRAGVRATSGPRTSRDSTPGVTWADA